MSQTSKELKEEIRKSKELLETLLDEVRVKIHLAGMDAKQTWQQLSAEAEKLTREVGQTSQTAVLDLANRLRKFLESLERTAKERSANKQP